MTTQRSRWFVLLVPLGAALLVRNQPSIGPDASSYLSMARSIVEDGPMRSLGSEQLYHAPGYPVLLSPLFLLDQRPFFAIVLLHAALAIATLLAVHCWFRRIAALDAGLLTALVACNSAFLLFGFRPLSEVAVMALIYGCALALQRLLGSARGEVAGRGVERNAGVALSIAAAIALSIALALTRQTGIFLIAAFWLVLSLQAWRRRMSYGRAALLALLIGAPAVLAVLGLMRHEWQTAAAPGGSGSTYVEQLVQSPGGLAQQVATATRFRVAEPGRLLVPGLSKVWGHTWTSPALLLHLPILAFLIWGAIRFLRRHPDDVLAWLFVITFCFYCTWPYSGGTRYLLPVLPVLIVFLHEALAIAGRHRRAILILLIVGHAIASAVVLTMDRIEARAQHRHWIEIDALAAVIAETPGTVVWDSQVDDARILLQLALDRNVERVPEDDAASAPARTAALAEAEWIVRDAAPGAGDRAFLLERQSR